MNNTYKTKCAICGTQCKNTNGLTIHIGSVHDISYKDYYDKYIDQETHICPYCKERELKFRNIQVGYAKTCSDRKCQVLALRNTYFKKTGFENPSQNPEVKQKKEQTTREHYGVDNPFQIGYVKEKAQSEDTVKKRVASVHEYYKNVSEEVRKKRIEKLTIARNSFSPEKRKEITRKQLETYNKKTEDEKRAIYEKVKQTKKSRYGSENYNNRIKMIRTCLQRYGVVNGGGTKESVRKIQNTKLKRYGNKSYVNPQKMVQTNMKKYGVRSPLQLYRGGGKISKLNLRIYRILNDLHVFFVPEFIITNGHHKRFYDIKFNNGIILEVNGDRVHANPQIFKDPEEQIRMQTYSFKAKDKWKYDESKRTLAEQNGYTVVYLWEMQIKKMHDEQIAEWLIENCKLVNHSGRISDQ